jgi:hypothetical protein
MVRLTFLLVLIVYPLLYHIIYKIINRIINLVNKYYLFTNFCTQITPTTFEVRLSELTPRDVRCLKFHTKCRILGPGCLMPDTGCWIPDCGYQISGTGYRMPSSGYQLPDAGCWIPGVGERGRHVEGGIGNIDLELTYSDAMTEPSCRQRRSACLEAWPNTGSGSRISMRILVSIAVIKDCHEAPA